jgi:predicted HD superfamily hydrolase involved in NAD metabolism
MKVLTVTAAFDPMTAEELKEIRRLKKEGNYHTVYLCPKEEGVLPYNDRWNLLVLALKPYRHMHAGIGKEGDSIALDPSFEQMEAEVRGGLFSHAAPGIRKALVDHAYYFETALDHRCNPHRAAHSRSVAALSKRLAGIHHMDEDLAWRAGILHDITKAWSKEEGERILSIYAPEILEYPAPVYHSYTAPVFLKAVMGITDQRILRAIETHTLGTGHTPLDWLLYIADKIEPNRNYDTTVETALAEKDLKAAFDLVFKEAELFRQKEKE